MRVLWLLMPFYSSLVFTFDDYDYDYYDTENPDAVPPYDPEPKCSESNSLLKTGQTPQERIRDACYNTTTETYTCNTCATILQTGILDGDITPVTSLRELFCCGTFSVSSVKQNFNCDISSWDVSAVTDMYSMFKDNYIFNQDLSDWDTSSVTDFSYMFYRARAFNGNVTGWDTSSGTQFGYMFFDARMFNQNIHAWDVSSATSLADMFNTALVFNQPIGNWNTSKVTTFIRTLRNARKFNQALNWDTSSATTLQSLFAQAYVFNQPLSLSIASITAYNKLDGIFSNARAFNQPVTWLAACSSRPTKFAFNSLFDYAYNFNQDVSFLGSCLYPNYQYTLHAMFRLAHDFEGIGVSSWDVTGITYLKATFESATSFNADLSSWDVSSLYSAESMFKGASAYEGIGLEYWDVSNLQYMGSMFRSATAFNGNIKNWNPYVRTASYCFASATSFDQPLFWDFSNLAAETNRYRLSNFFTSSNGMQSCNKYFTYMSINATVDLASGINLDNTDEIQSWASEPSCPYPPPSPPPPPSSPPSPPFTPPAPPFSPSPPSFPPSPPSFPPPPSLPPSPPNLPPSSPPPYFPPPPPPLSPPSPPSPPFPPPYPPMPPISPMSFLQFVNDSKTYSEAESHCSSLSGTLVQSISAEQIAQVAAQMESDLPGVDFVWIGLKRTDGTWQWDDRMQLLTPPLPPSFPPPVPPLPYSLVQSISGTNSDTRLGFQTSMSTDGTVLVTAGSREDSLSTPDSGAVYIYRRTNGIYTLEQKILGMYNGIYYGEDLDIDGAGARITVRAKPNYNDHLNETSGSTNITESEAHLWPGFLDVYDYNPLQTPAWTKSIRFTSHVWKAQFGNHQISKDGTHIIVSGSKHGFVQVYHRVEISGQYEWTQKGSIIEKEANSFGTDVDINYDGSRIAIGSTGYNTVWIYEYVNNDWEVVHNKITGEGKFGAHVKFNLDGTMVAITSPESSVSNVGNNVGAMYVFRDFIGEWTRVGSIMTGKTVSGDKFGENSVDISDDGSLVIAGSAKHNGSDGYVRLYFNNGNDWETFDTFDGQSGEANKKQQGIISRNKWVIATGEPYADYNSSTLRGGILRIYDQTLNPPASPPSLV